MVPTVAFTAQCLDAFTVGFHPHHTRTSLSPLHSPPPADSPHHSSMYTSSPIHFWSPGSHCYRNCSCLIPSVSPHGRGWYPHKYNSPPPEWRGSPCYYCKGNHRSPYLQVVGWVEEPRQSIERGKDCYVPPGKQRLGETQRYFSVSFPNNFPCILPWGRSMIA